jgi:hypothetical protein
MTSDGRALLRFWWLLAFGVVAAVLAGVVAVYHVKLSLPPKLEARKTVVYTASAQLLVNSSANPYLRTGVTTVQPRPAKTVEPRTTSKKGTGTSSGSLSTIPQAPNVSVQTPDTRPLVDAANFFPLLIESAQVTARRTKMFGPLRGTITARAIYSSSTATRFRASDFPVIVISGTAATAAKAKRLAQATSLAFQRWLVDKQNRSRVPRGQRILLEQLQAPTSATPSGGTKYGLPLFIAFVVLGAFIGLAVVLDRMFPRREPAAIEPAPTPSLPRAESEREETGMVALEEKTQAVAASPRPVPRWHRVSGD